MSQLLPITHCREYFMIWDEPREGAAAHQELLQSHIPAPGKEWWSYSNHHHKWLLLCRVTADRERPGYLWSWCLGNINPSVQHWFGRATWGYQHSCCLDYTWFTERGTTLCWCIHEKITHWREKKRTFKKCKFVVLYPICSCLLSKRPIWSENMQHLCKFLCIHAWSVKYSLL